METELFRQTYKSYGVATVRYPVLEVTATVKAFETGGLFVPRVAGGSAVGLSTPFTGLCGTALLSHV